LKTGHRSKGDDKPKVPGYIVTFSDMITLLLTFFVMLLSLAKVQDPELFETGRDSFIQSLQSLGIGVLLGGTNNAELGKMKIKYAIEKAEEPPANRNIDVLEEQLRAHYLKAEQMMDTVTSETVSGQTAFSVTNIHFSGGSYLLDEDSQRFLKAFSLGLEQSPVHEGSKVYVLGVANDVSGGKAQWVVSAKRARAVADFLRGVLPSGYSRCVYSFGSGAGGQWTGPKGVLSKQSQILLMILRAG